MARPNETRLKLIRLKDQQNFEFIKVQEPTVRALKLLAGEIDMIQNNLPPELVGYLSKNSRLQIQRNHGNNFSYVGLNFENEHTKQLAVRQAIAHAIDRKKIIQYVMGGGARPAQSLLPPDHWASAYNLKTYKYKP